MNTLTKIAMLLVLPGLAFILYPPGMLIMSSPVAAGVVFLLVAGLGALAWRGSSNAMTLLIFAVGMNAIARLMMLFPNAVSEAGVLNAPFIAADLVALGLSIFLLLYLDRPLVKAQILRSRR